MLEQAKSRGYAGAEWKLGSAEHIPLESGSVDLVWMSQVFHHIEDAAAAFREIRRALRPSGFLAIRNGVRENDAEIEWFHCFPEARLIDEQRVPRREDLVSLVRNHGFELIGRNVVYQYFASSYREYYGKIAQRGLSALIAISDAEFNAGLERLKQWVAEQPADKPVYEPVDLFVFKLQKE
jgi:ubiquinone/menaquinone biosynthesis C-methylase UbiE